MKFNVNDGILTVFADGRIDSSNAEAFGAELGEIRDSNPHTSTVIDAENLEYISSAGLRVVLKTRKAEKEFRIVNVSPEVYDIFDMTGFTEMLTVEKAFRKFDVEGCEIIGKGAKGTVYRYNADTIVKVYHNPESLPDIQNERALARRAFVLGIPTAISYDIVKVGNTYGSVFELLNARTYTQCIAENPGNYDKYVKNFAELALKIHSTSVNKDDMPDIRKFVLGWVETDKPFLPADKYEKLKKLIEDVPEKLTMIHCDFHTNNIMIQGDETLLIDMDTLSHGDPIFELANVYITYVGFGEIDRSMTEGFLKLPYGTSVDVWNKFIRYYLGTDDEKRVAEVEDKIRLVCYTRLLRHYVRRDSESDIAKKTIEYTVPKISELVDKLDTVEFC